MVFDRAARASGREGLTPHSLWHTAASLAITSGADVKVVQQMLGHASDHDDARSVRASVRDRLDEVADRMDQLRTERGPPADSLRTKPQLIMFPELDQDAAGQ
jgi:integrase